MLFAEQTLDQKTTSQLKLSALSDTLLQSLDSLGTAIVTDIDDIKAQSGQGDVILTLEEGQLGVFHDHQPLFLFETGDIINLGRFRQSEMSLIFNGEVTVERHCLKTDPLISAPLMTRLSQYFSSVLVEAINFRKKLLESIDKGFLQFKSGDVIIKQGDEAEYVYSLLNGHAEVYQNGVAVGEILKDEVFGSLSIFTNQPRNASVIATSACTVLTVPKNQFRLLMQARPDLCQNLLSSMARKIDVLNASLTNKSA